ncbi:MAG: helix-turn-helix domain-containing protein [Pleurocapsa sp. MO_226.B13]|nr:helix-turn-helix domain-containing protein [Pleurocapsa sp. MO_226.B13]
MKKASYKTEKKFSLESNSNTQFTVAYIVEHTLGCKWMLKVLSLIREGVNRPGAMTRAVDGLSTKVLNERLSELLNFGIVNKISYPEIPPRVEYEFTEFGLRFIKILDTIDELEEFHRQKRQD